jgi:nitroimidazol reductase NimA-like FMN-containing flavoprotein (pyridoxamine 5'-phosphate oxidase superfamily)
MRRIQHGLEAATADTVRQLLDGQHYAVLSTHRKGHPYCSLVAYVATPDLLHGVFATHRTTNKYANLTENPRVSLLVDDRRNTQDDIRQAVALTILGTAREVNAGERREMQSLYAARHPHLEQFALDDDCALFDVTVAEYMLVKQFEDVVVVLPHADGAASAAK